MKYGKIKHERIVTLYNGIDLSVFDPLNETVREQKRASLGIPSAATIFLTIAVLREPKGIQYMLAAMPQILQAEPSARYLVVGDGAHGDALKEFTRSHGLDSHVTFTGQRTDIHEILAASDVFVLPTLIDALPTVLIEAMSAGKAVIASSVGGVPEIVVNGISGILIEPAEPLQLVESCLKLAQDKALRDAMARGAKNIT
ncbi:MAG: glycosyltransferase family 4 protein [Anaerolineales bacterium]|nr:glycosyltransferase family 4 protein [Anaerolineales bacterium]